MFGRRLIAIALALLATTPASAQVVQPDFWGTDGEVTSIARVGNTIYLAGSFSNVGPATGGAVPIDRRTGEPWPSFQRVNGIVHAVIPDGDGGWFVGGDFTAVEGEPHHNVAHLRADGTVDPWDPGVGDVEYVIRSGTVNPIHTVSALGLAGDVLYIGGRFEAVGGQPRHAIAAVNATTGALLDWDPQPDGMVTALVAERGTLFVGGSFTTMAGQPRSRAAAFRLADGSLTAWNPSADGTVLTIALARNLAWIGGEFDHVGGHLRNSVAAVTLDSGAVTPWDAALKPLRSYIAHGDWIWPYVSSIAVRGHSLFVGGWFYSASGAARSQLAELDLTTARATAFDAHVGDGLVKALALQGQTLYVGGYLYGFGDAGRPNLAALDARTGATTVWNPRADGTVLALAADGNTVLAGGQFTSMGEWQPRPGLAALDATTGQALPWDPTLDAPYYGTVAAGSDRVYLSGRFTSVDGQPRGHFAAFDGATGALTDWNPWSSGVTSLDAQRVRMVVVGDTLYVAAPVESINGVPRHNLFAVDGRTGALLPWAPNPRARRYHYGSRAGQVGAMGAFDGTLFVAGEFDTIGGAPRSLVAQLDGTTGLAIPWVQNADPLASLTWFDPNAIVSDGSTVFVGAWFYLWPEYMGLLAFDPSGSVRPWTPVLESEHATYVGSQPEARALALHGNTLFVGGRFDRIAGELRPDLGAIDATTGAVLPWDSDMRTGYTHPFDAVDALALVDDVLYVGGRFTRLGGYPSRGFAALALTPRSAWLRKAIAPATARGVTLALTPNPARGRVRLTFSLPAPATVSLGVFDVAGRRVAAPLDRSLERAGEHNLLLDTARLRAGVYYSRLDVDGVTSTRRFVVLD
jgi:hypothetical protein